MVSCFTETSEIVEDLDCRDHDQPRPMVRWVGGKTRLLPELLRRVPKDFGTYHEPFLGGGTLYWRMVALGRLTSRHGIFLSDVNNELMNVYRVVKDRLGALRNRLLLLQDTEENYYHVRSSNPTDIVDRAARFLFLNKTCFNGLYRVNAKGAFNVPYDATRRGKRLVCDSANLESCSHALRTTCPHLDTAPFESVLDIAESGDLVYLDSPYLPLSKTSDFTKYAQDGFTYADHERLRDVASELKKRGCAIVLSASSSEMSRDLYSRGGFIVEEVECPRSVNSNGAGRGNVKELIVT